MENKEVQKSTRECGMLVTVASQGTGKTHANKHLICNYAMDKIATKVRGRKVLIFDVNSEYETTSFGIEGIPKQEVKGLAVSDVAAWCNSNVVDVRRINVRTLHMDDKLKVLNHVIQEVKNCLFVIEDINKIVLDVAHLKQIVGTIVGLRHRAVDVIVSYQALRDVPPRFLSNCKYVRMHYFSGDAADVAKKLTEPEVYRLAQLIVNKRYYEAVRDFKAGKISDLEHKKRRSFCVYIWTDPHKIEGEFTRDEFVEACKKYLLINKSAVKDRQLITGCSIDEAMSLEAEELILKYYGNSDEPKKNIRK